jgi:hypothetical protein
VRVLRDQQEAAMETGDVASAEAWGDIAEAAADILAENDL